MLTESSDFLINRFWHQFFKSVWAEIVEKLLEVLVIILVVHQLRSSNVEIDSDVHWHSNVVLGWNVSDWASVSDGVFWDHANWSLVAAVAPVASRFHDARIDTPSLFEAVHSIWDIKFPNTRALIVDHAHDWNTLVTFFWNNSRTFPWMVCVQLDQTGLSSHCTLCVIIESVLLSGELVGTCLELSIWMHFKKFIFLLI